MARQDSGKRRRQIKRRLQPRGARQAEEQQRNRERLAAELSDPRRFAEHLRTFTQLALMDDELAVCRFPAEPFLELLTETEVPPGEPGARRAALEQALIPPFAEEARATRCHAAISTAMDRRRSTEQVLALMAAGALATSCLQQQAAPGHPFWRMLLDLTLSEALLTGRFLVTLVRRAQEGPAEPIAAAFARALLDPELGDELARLGLDDPNPAELARTFGSVLRDPNLYHLELDAVLHLMRAHLDMIEDPGRELLRGGLDAALRERFLARYEQAYAGDLSEGLCSELQTWFRRRLERLRDEPDSFGDQLPRGVETERRRCLASYLALRSFPLVESAFLRAVHVQSLERARSFAPELERGAAESLWHDPDDLYALEQYERLLLELGHPQRAGRVRRYLPHARARRAKTSASEAGAPAEPDASSSAGEAGA